MKSIQNVSEFGEFGIAMLPYSVIRVLLNL